MKKIAVLFLSLCMIFGLCGCASNTSSSTSSADLSSVASSLSTTSSKAASVAASIVESASSENTSGKTYTIGMDVSRLTNEAFVQFAAKFQAFCDEKGWKFISSENEENSATMVSNLENMKTAGCNAIFSQNIDPKASADIYQQIVDAGIVLVAYDTPSDIATYNFSCDNAELGKAVGKMAGDWANTNMDGKANAIVFQVPSAEFLVTRSKGMQAGFKEESPNSSIVDVVDINMDTVSDMVENTLQAHPDANAFIFPGDTDAYTAYQIINEEITRKGLDASKFAIFGVDASESVLPLIKQGTIFRGSMDLGLKTEVPKEACEAIEYSLTGKGTKYEQNNYYPLNPVTIDNVSKFMN